MNIFLYAHWTLRCQVSKRPPQQNVQKLMDFTGWVPFTTPNQRCQSIEEALYSSRLKPENYKPVCQTHKYQDQQKNTTNIRISAGFRLKLRASQSIRISQNFRFFFCILSIRILQNFRFFLHFNHYVAFVCFIIAACHSRQPNDKHVISKWIHLKTICIVHFKYLGIKWFKSMNVLNFVVTQTVVKLLRP